MPVLLRHPAFSGSLSAVRGEEGEFEAQSVWVTGHDTLDAHLPGGGWPLGTLIELLLPNPDMALWRLLLPALCRKLRRQSGPLVMVGEPQQPWHTSLQTQGLPAQRLLSLQADPALLPWATEQALRCPDVVAVLAWLPQARDAELRRLHLAAQAHSPLLFVLRPIEAGVHASPARLRLSVQTDPADPEVWAIRILKRAGPPLDYVLRLAAYTPRLRALMTSRRQPAALVRVATRLPAPAPAPTPVLTPMSMPTPALTSEAAFRFLAALS